MDKRFYIVICCSLLYMLMISSAAGSGKDVQSAGQTYFQELDRLSQSVLELTKQGDYAQAKSKLEELAQLFTKIGDRKKMSIEALEIASNTIVMGKRSFSAITPDKDQLMWHSYQIRVMIDAITHPHQPIWKSYHTPFLEQVSKMLHLSSREDQKNLHPALEHNYKLYNTLKPAFAINQSPQTLEMMDSIYHFVYQQTRGKVQDWSAVQSSLEQLRQTADHVFLGKEEFTLAWYISSNSPAAMIALMSSILLTVLTYVAWRMYRGGQHKAT